MTKSKYPALLSPATIANMTVRNRMICLGEPHHIQGTEDFPSRGTIIHYANKAKSGAGFNRII